MFIDSFQPFELRFIRLCELFKALPFFFKEFPQGAFNKLRRMGHGGAFPRRQKGTETAVAQGGKLRLVKGIEPFSALGVEAVEYAEDQ